MPDICAHALRAQGVGVTNEDLLDLRKGENRPAGSSARDLNEMARQSDPIKALLDLIEASDGIARESGNIATASHRAGGLTLIINNYAGKPDA